MVFKPGQSGNPGGRKPGTRNHKTLAAEQAIAAGNVGGQNGHKAVDPQDLLASIVACAETNLALRMQAALGLMPFLHARKSTRYIDHAIDLPPPTSVEEATANIARIASLAAAKTIGLDEANDLVGLQKSYIEAKIGTDAEAQLAALKQALRDHPNLAFDLTVVGGLPTMPGLEGVSMPPRTLAVSVDRDRSALADDTNGSGS
jgi:hypothetical protein